jgi:hypothetical protein
MQPTITAHRLSQPNDNPIRFRWMVGPNSHSGTLAWNAGVENLFSLGCRDHHGSMWSFQDSIKSRPAAGIDIVCLP